MIYVEQSDDATACLGNSRRRNDILSIIENSRFPLQDFHAEPALLQTLYTKPSAEVQKLARKAGRKDWLISTYVVNPWVVCNPYPCTIRQSLDLNTILLLLL